MQNRIATKARRTDHIKQRPGRCQRRRARHSLCKVMAPDLANSGASGRQSPTPVVTRVHPTRTIIRPPVSSTTRKPVWTRNGEKTLDRKGPVVRWKGGYDDGSRRFVGPSKQITNNLTQRNTNPRL